MAIPGYQAAVRPYCRYMLTHLISVVTLKRALPSLIKLSTGPNSQRTAFDFVSGRLLHPRLAAVVLLHLLQAAAVGLAARVKLQKHS